MEKRERELFLGLLYNNARIIIQLSNNSSTEWSIIIARGRC